MNITLFRHGFALLLVSLLIGLLVPSMVIPRLGLAAHTVGLMSAILLIALGAIWQHFRVTGGQGTVLKWMWLYSSWANWLGCVLGALTGAGRFTPIASAGRIGTPLAEGVVAVLLGSVAVTSISSAAMSFWALRPTGTTGTILATE